MDEDGEFGADMVGYCGDKFEDTIKYGLGIVAVLGEYVPCRNTPLGASHSRIFGHDDLDRKMVVALVVSAHAGMRANADPGPRHFTGTLALQPHQRVQDAVSDLPNASH